MAITLAVGTTVAIASAYAAAKTMSAITNATSAVATLEASHGVVLNDFVEITSGWARLNGRIAKATNIATNDVTLGGIDTSSTARYPSGSGAGTVREISTWTTIGQIARAINVSGGEQQFADITTLEDVIDKQIPTRRSPVQVRLPLFFDPALSYVSSVRTASDTAVPTAVRMTFPNGSVLVANAYWSYQEVPTIEDETLRTSIDLAFVALPTIYTS
jgi:hypothetical protein